MYTMHFKYLYPPAKTTEKSKCCSIEKLIYCLTQTNVHNAKLYDMYPQGYRELPAGQLQLKHKDKGFSFKYC